VVDAPAHGTVSIAGNVATYSPDADYAGPDSFTFRAADGPAAAAWSYSNTATVSVVVGDANDPPTATDQSITTDEDAPIAVLLEGTDPDGDALTFTVHGGPAHGTLTGNAHALTYSPDADFFGDDSFTFQADDGRSLMVLSVDPVTRAAATTIVVYDRR
jgi:hypothetical protein